MHVVVGDPRVSEVCEYRFAFALGVLPAAKTEGFRIAGSNNAGIQISQIQLKFCYFTTVRNMMDLFPLGNRSGTYSQNDRPCCTARRSCGPIDCYLSILGHSLVELAAARNRYQHAASGYQIIGHSLSISRPQTGPSSNHGGITSANLAAA